MASQSGKILGQKSVAALSEDNGRLVLDGAIQQRVLESIARGNPLSETLGELVRHIEQLFPRITASFMLLDQPTKTMRLIAGGSLPTEYAEKINGLAIGPQIGSCGTAMYFGHNVYVNDIHSDPLWENFVDLATKFGFRACWSIPILSRISEDNRVLGTFALYADVPGPIAPGVDDLISQTEYLACIAIENDLARAQLRAQEEQYRALISALAEGVFYVSTDMQIVMCNDSATRILGIEKGALIGRSSLDPGWNAVYEDGTLFPSDSHPSQITIRTGKPCLDVLMGIRRGDGSRIWISINSQPIFANDPSAPIGAVCSFSDVTERKRSQDALRESEKQLRIALQAAGAIGFRWDIPADEITRYFSREPALPETQDRPWTLDEVRKVVHPDDLQKFEDSIRDCFASGTEYRNHFRVIRPNGEIRSLEEKGLLERDSSGCPMRLIGVSVDVTDELRIQEQLRDAQKLEAVGRLAGGIAHDFNNLLTVVNGYAELLTSSNRVNEIDRIDFAQSILGAGRRAASLTSQLLAFSRRATTVPVPLKINHVISSSLPFLKKFIPKDVLLEVNLGKFDTCVLADPSQIEQALINLVTNGRDAMPQGGALLIRTRLVCRNNPNQLRISKPNNFVALMVSDTGIGMSEEVRSQVFEPFFSTKSTGKGTGLGLAVVHGIAHQCGGEVLVESAPGQGSTFTVLFPVSEHVALPLQPKANPAPVQGWETILLVEDDDPVRTISRLSLQAAGFQVIEASSARAALEILQSPPRPIHAIITDIIMPEVDGSRLAAKIREVLPDIPILFTTGHAAPGLVVGLLKLTRTSFLPKPYSAAEMLQGIRQLIDDNLTLSQN